jgi:hypothetical protein
MLNPNSEGVSLFRLRWVGYALLIFSLLDSFDTLTPLQLMNAEWERLTIGALVERTPLLIMGLALVFNGETYRRRKLELLALKAISWFCLVLCVFFFALIPLGMVSSFRVYNQSQQATSTQYQQQLSQLRLTEERFQKASDADLQAYARQLQQRAIQQTGQPVPALNSPDPKAFRQQLLSQVKDGKARLEADTANFRGAQQRTLLKDALKWTLGALIVSVICFMFWQSSVWLRKPKPEGLPTRPEPNVPKPSSADKTQPPVNSDTE